MKNVVSPVDAKENGLCPLVVHPFRYRAIGSIAESALPFRFWVGVVFDTLTVEAKNEVNGKTGQTIRRMDGLLMKSMYSRGDHPRLMKACRFVFARPEECVLGQCSLASPT